MTSVKSPTIPTGGKKNGKNNRKKDGIVIFGKGFNSILVLDEMAQLSFSKQSIFHSYFKF